MSGTRIASVSGLRGVAGGHSADVPLATIDVGLAGIWLAFAFAIGREHRRRTGKPHD